MWIFFLVIIVGLFVYLGIKFDWFSKITIPSGTGFWAGAKNYWSVILTVALLGFLGYWILWDQFPATKITTTILLIVVLTLAAIFQNGKWWLALLLVGGILIYQHGCNSSQTPAGGKESDNATVPATRVPPVYQPGDVIFDGMTPCHPIIPTGYDLTPTGPVKLVFQTESGTAIRRIREEAEDPPADRLRNRPVVITSLTVGVEYHVIIIAR